MISIGWKTAIKNIPSKGYRLTKNGRYEAYVSDHSKSLSLGTYDTEAEAKEAVFNYRVNRLISAVSSHGLNIDNGVIYDNNYIAFKNGMIFNLHGVQILGGVNKSGYRQGVFNGRTRDHHRIIADCFIDNPDNLRDVNHKNGNKLDLNIENLERITHSDNIKHSYKHGLQTKITNPHGTFRVLNDDDLERIHSLHLRGYLDREIAERIGCSREIVSRKIREMKLR